ncbi:hypothetical protein BSL78_00753 [Apostichopus japonicus]|uniref:G-protein coupled receptors family 3 profile domain-containing protein n=1 Tax=Stichopus japonicus TaxID=307972 RepID=A0A2G8LQ28_STIJA|nr:hypothetical protein BSL78_00753 [Apostichopus japonicus]
MYEWNIRRVICEAFKLGMYGEGYMWLIPGWYNKDWYKEEPDSGIDCTVGEISLFIESTMYISTQERLLGKEDTVTVAGITPAEYTSQLWEHFSLREDEFQNYTMIPQASYGYDAIWAVALALNRSVEVLKAKVFSNGQQRRLEQFSHGDDEMFDVIFDALGSVDFEGVSGPVSFSGSDRIGVMKIEQLQGGCPGDWTHRGRYCYLFLSSELTWDEAVSSCSDLGGFLLSISSEEESLSLKELITEQDLGDGKRWWISLRRLPSGDLRWSDGLEESVMWYLQTGRPIDAARWPLLHPGLECERSVFRLHAARKAFFICKQFAEFLEVTVAEHDLAKDEIEWFSDIIWPGGAVPLDHTPQVIFTTVEIYEGVPFFVYIISCCLAGLGMILAVVCLVFNIYHRNQRFIKLSSPNLNSLIIFGCIMIYASTCLVGWEDPSINQAIFLKFCQIRVWFFSVGFVLSFGSMFSKTWRVHKVAALKNPKRVIITDRHLFLMVGVLLLIDVSLLSGWFIFNPMRVVKEYLHSEEDSENLLILTPYIQYCTTDNSLIWQCTLYGYKALLLIFGVFLAWETRKVTIPALNDSKLIGLCVYNVVLLSAIGVGVNLALTTDPSPSFIFTSAIQIFCTSVTLIIIFIPKDASSGGVSIQSGGGCPPPPDGLKWTAGALFSLLPHFTYS